VKARPAGAAAATYFRVRQDKVDKAGKVSLRYDSRLYKIGIGRAHRGRQVKLLIADQNIRVIDQQGELIREQMRPHESRLPVLGGSADASDLSDDLSVATVLPRRSGFRTSDRCCVSVMGTTKASVALLCARGVLHRLHDRL
jgi:hypothetical protein